MALSGVRSVLHAPGAVGGNPQGLSRALRKIGLHSVSVVVAQNYLGYPADIVLQKEGEGLFRRELRRLWWIIFELPRFDVVHYNAGSTLAGFYPLMLASGSGWRRALKVLYVQYLRGFPSRLDDRTLRWFDQVVQRLSDEAHYRFSKSHCL